MLTDFNNHITSIIDDRSFWNKVNLEQPRSTDNDLSLVGCWMQKQKTKKESEDSDFRRLLSARLAEVALAGFFRDEEKDVVDVSITQVNSIQNDNWKRYDLLVDGVPYDVKNATRSERNKDRYVSHCVPSFKETRDGKDDQNYIAVKIAGVLSDWQVNPGDCFNLLLFLGETTKKDQDILQAEFSDDILDVNFQKSNLDVKKFLPPWIFNYPQYLYKLRDDFLKKLDTLPFPDWRICEEDNINPLPAYIAAGLKYVCNPAINLTKSQIEFETILRSRISKMGLSLPVVFLTVLHHFLTTLLSDSTESYSPKDYRKIIFPKLFDTTNPLFLYDQLRTIDKLIDNLSILWDKKVEGLNNFKIFELKGFNILCGRKNINDQFSTTLLAYCGGWKDERPCGNVPLVYGIHSNCPHCGRLKCNVCGYCSSKCQLT